MRYSPESFCLFSFLVFPSCLLLGRVRGCGSLGSSFMGCMVHGTSVLSLPSNMGLLPWLCQHWGWGFPWCLMWCEAFPSYMTSMCLHQRRGVWGESWTSVLLELGGPARCQLLPAGLGQAGCRCWHGCFFLLQFVNVQMPNSPFLLIKVLIWWHMQ